MIPAADKLRAWLRESSPPSIFGGLALLAFAELWLLWPVHRTMDWPIWDEAMYAGRGLQWARVGGILGDLHSSPLYVAAYGLLSHFTSIEGAIFVQHYLLKLASTVLLYAVLVRWWRSWPAALAAALLWGAGDFNLQMSLLVYHAAWIWFLAALLVADRWPLASIGLTALAACTRQEYQFALLVLGGWFILRSGRSSWGWRDWVGAGGTHSTRLAGGAIAAAVGVLLAAVAMQTTVQRSRDRAWFAFQQHYALRAVRTAEWSGANPWLDYPQIVQRDFPGATSLGSACRINPRAVAKHVLHNLMHAPAELWRLAKPDGRLKRAGVFLLLGVAVALAGRRTDPVPRQPWSASVVLAASAGLVIAPGLLVLAKSSYLLPVIPGLVGGAGWVVGRLFGRTRFSGERWLGAGASAVGIGIVLWFVAPRIFVPGTYPRPVAETVVELRKIWPREGRAVLVGVGASSYAQYLGIENCEGIEPLSEADGKTAPMVPLTEVMRRYSPQAVLVTPEWRESSRFDPVAINALFPPPVWVSRALPAGELYWRTR